MRSSGHRTRSCSRSTRSCNRATKSSRPPRRSCNRSTRKMQTVNAELHNKIEELDRANTDLQNLFQSSQIATIFLDRSLVIRSFTPAVTKIFSLIPGDRGRPLTDIVSRLDHQDLEADIRAVFASGETIERSVSLAGDSIYYLARILPY